MGLLGTFIGLIAALTFATQTLTAAVDQKQIKDALKDLLTTAAAKFYISAAGLVAFLVLSFCIRLGLKHLHGLVRSISDCLDERIFFLNLLAISEKQLNLQQGSLDELKLFNTNIAMKVGDAVRSAIETTNNNLTAKLDQIAGAFGKLIDASREGAGSAVNEAMKGIFDASLRQTSDALGNIASALQDLPNRLASAASSIQNAGEVAAEQQKRLSESIQRAVEEILQNATSHITNSVDRSTSNLAENLSNAGASFGDSAARIGSVLERFTNSGDDYMKALSSLTDKTTALQGELSSISSNISVAANSLTSAGAAVDQNLEKVLSGITQSTRIAEETNRSIRASQEAINGAVDSLRSAMTTHIQRFDQVDEKLAGVFRSITSHLEEQSRQIAENLSTMDHALASAVNQFEQLIENLIEVRAAPVPA